MHVLGWLVAGVLSTAAPVRPTTVALLPFQPSGVPGDRAVKVQEYFRDALKSFPGVQLQTWESTLEVLDQVKGPGQECGMDAQCVATVQRVSGADVVLSGSVAPQGSALNVSAIALRVGSSEARTWSTLVSLEDPTAASTISELAAQVFDPRLVAGAMELDCPVERAAVMLANGEVRPCPFRAEVTDLVPGQHVVQVLEDGQAQAQLRVDVSYARTTVVRVRREAGQLTIAQDPETRPLTWAAPSVAPVLPGSEAPEPEDAGATFPGIFTYAGSGVGAAGALVGLGALAVGAALASVGGLLYAQLPRTPDGLIVANPGEPAQDAQMRAGAIFVLMPVGGVLAVAGVVALLGALGVAAALVIVDVVL